MLVISDRPKLVTSYRQKEIYQITLHKSINKRSKLATEKHDGGETSRRYEEINHDAT